MLNEASASFENPTGIFTLSAGPFQSGEERLFSFVKACTVLKTFRNKGVPANESGLTGPIVIKLYWREAVSNEL